jgi:hypothetical protein
MGSDITDEEGQGQLFQTHKPSRSLADIEEAEGQITQNIRDVRYIVREYPAEVVVQKYLHDIKDDKNEIYVPDYQRELIWPEKTNPDSLNHC